MVPPLSIKTKDILSRIVVLPILAGMGGNAVWAALEDD